MSIKEHFAQPWRQAVAVSIALLLVASIFSGHHNTGGGLSWARDHYRADRPRSVSNLPGDFYQVLRVVMAVACILSAPPVFLRSPTRSMGMWLLLFLYNPLVPLRLGLEAWRIVNVATLVFLTEFLIFDWRNPDAPAPQKARTNARSGGDADAERNAEG